MPFTESIKISSTFGPHETRKTVNNKNNENNLATFFHIVPP